MNTLRLCAAIAAWTALTAACDSNGATPEAETAPVAAAADSAPTQAATAAITDPGPKTELPPNELGEIMVLEYHRLGEREGEFIRRAENFQKDLEALHARGYRPITMRNVLAGDFELPAGTTPVVVTIDDSSLGQFYLQPDGSIDPNTMMGMWAAFKEQNPGWRQGAVWCVLPAADHPSNFFGEKPSREVPREERERRIKQKMTYLVENDHEICNHTLYHARLDRGTDAQVQEWIGRGEDSIQVYLPEGYEIVTLALPLGMWPKNRSLAWSGTWKGEPYSYEAVLEVSGGPNVSPFDARFDPKSVDRFIVAPGALERQLEAYEKNPGRRFVSDGDPNTVTVPRTLEARLNRERIGNREVRLIDHAAAPGAAAAAPQP